MPDRFLLLFGMEFDVPFNNYDHIETYLLECQGTMPYLFRTGLMGSLQSNRCVQCSQSRPWPVLVICSVQCFSALGIAYGMGALYTDLRETFQASHPMAALVQSLCVGLTSVAGVVTGPVIQRCGPRVSMVLGSLLSTAGCLLAFFATDIVVVVVGMGVMQGVGVSFSYMSSLVTIRFLFNDIRSAAITCVTVSGAAGSATYPLLLRYLVHTYALRGTFLILSAINVQLILFGVLCGTFSHSKRLWTEGDNFEADVEMSPQVTARLQGDHDLRHHQKSSPQVTARRQDQCSHRDEQLTEETIVTDGPIPDERALVTYPMVSVTCGNTEVDASPSLQDSHAEHNGQPSKSVGITYHRGAIHSDEDIPRGDVKPMQMSQQWDKTSNDEPTESIDKDDSARDRLLHTADSEREVKGHSHSAHKLSLLEMEGSGKEKRTSAIEEDKPIYPSKPQSERTKGPLLSCLRLQLEVLRNVRFVMFMATLTTFSSNMTASIFMTDLVRDDGLSAEDGSFFLTLVFVGNLVGRLIVGVLGHVLKDRIYIAFAVIVSALGVACLCFTLTSTYLSYFPVCLFYGLCFGLFVTGVSLVNISILPRHLYAAGLGISSFVAGLSMCLIGTLGGLVRDYSGEFGPMFYLSFGHALFHGSLLFITYFRTEAGARGKK